MSQQAISTYFSSRKRTASDDLTTSKNKVLILDRETVFSPSLPKRKIQAAQKLTFDTNFGSQKDDKPAQKKSTSKKRSAPTKSQNAKRSKNKEPEEKTDGLQQTNLVNFIRKGLLSPVKLQSPVKVMTPEKSAFCSRENELNAERGMVTPVKQTIPSEPRPGSSKKSISDISLDKMKQSLQKSSRITELKTRLNKLQQGIDRLDSMEESRKAAESIKEQKKSTFAAVKSLKQFDTFEVEVTSPRKDFTSPVKLQYRATQKHDLMTPTKDSKATTSLFSPSKKLNSPLKSPAHQRFQHLVETGRPTLQLPYKYRYILEVFKSVDTVCAMLFNRNEKITFKKLKPAVQRMMRKNFHESHLAQIKQLYSDAYNFYIEKTRNFGSETKHDTHQLTIVPIVKNLIDTNESKLADKDNVIQTAEKSLMNPQMLIARTNILSNVLTEMVKDEHQKFLQTLDPPMNIDRNKLTRWHPEFDLEACPEVKRAELPQPPHQDRLTSAKDVLSTARNLFNCGTDMEKALERLQERKEKEANEVLATPLKHTSAVPKPIESSLLKGVPKSLLDKIRQKQAAKALDAMTRRPSQDKEATSYSRLPELARHVRNVFVTERKGVLPLEHVLLKIENSYRENLNQRELEEHLRLITKEIPLWISLQCVRKQMYVKCAKDMNIKEVLTILEKLAAEKSK